MERVSVVIPNYNCAPYLSKAIESILSQTYQNFELLICDDGSTDGSLSIAKEWQKKDERIKVLENKENKGYLYTYNRLIFAATGEYILVQDADDWSDYQRIEKQIAVVLANNVDLCLTNFVIYDSNKGIANYKKKSYSGFVDVNDEDRWGAPATILFKREVLKKIPGFNTYFDRLTGMDRYFLLEILCTYKGYFLDEYLYNVLARPNSDHRAIMLNEETSLRKMIAIDIYHKLKLQRVQTGTDWLKIKDFNSIKAYEDQLINNKALIAEKYRVFACTQIDHNQFRLAFPLLKAAVIEAPLYVKTYQTMFYLLRAIVAKFIILW